MMGPLWRLASESAILSEAAPVYILATACQLEVDGKTARRRDGKMSRCGDEAGYNPGTMIRVRESRSRSVTV
jgi:hypothetical protein